MHQKVARASFSKGGHRNFQNTRVQLITPLEARVRVGHSYFLISTCGIQKQFVSWPNIQADTANAFEFFFFSHVAVRLAIHVARHACMDRNAVVLGYCCVEQRIPHPKEEVSYFSQACAKGAAFGRLIWHPHGSPQKTRTAAARTAVFLKAGRRSGAFIFRVASVHHDHNVLLGPKSFHCFVPRYQPPALFSPLWFLADVSCSSPFQSDSTHI